MRREGPVRLALVAAPWFSLQTPPIPVATLAAWVRARTEVEVSCFHPFLHVADRLGPAYYREVQTTPFAGSLGLVLYYDMDRQAAAEVLRARVHTPGSVQRLTMGARLRTADDALALIEDVESALRAWVASIDWSAFDVIGFSNAHSQLFHSAFLAAEIRRWGSKAVIVFGGSECNPALAGNLAKHLPEVDAVVCGEGELPMQRILEAVEGAGEDWRASAVDPSIFLTAPAAEAASPPPIGGCVQLPDLGELPLPSYDEYFEQLSNTSIENEVRRFLTPFVEVGRGCYWSKPVAEAPGYKGCAFCGEKNLWDGYRHKTADRVVAEVSYLTSRYEFTNVFLVDSGIRPSLAKAIFEGIRELDTDIAYSLNVRANVPPDLFRLFEECAVVHLTVGFESLSSDALRRMNKGTRTIDALYMLKKCQQHGISHDGRLIVYHPGIAPEDLEEVLENLEYAQYFAPLGANPFQLLAGSAIAMSPEAYGVSRVRNHPMFRDLLPPEAYESLEFYRKEFDDLHRDETYPVWNRIEQRLKRWLSDHGRLMSVTGVPPLSLCDGGSFLEILRRTIDGREILEEMFRLRGRAAELYRLCDEPQRIERLAEATGLSEEEVETLLDPLVERKVAFKEGRQYLALAVAQPGHHVTTYLELA